MKTRFNTTCARQTIRSTRISKQRGFTLIELMVAMSLFAIVMVMSMSSVFTIISANRKAQALSSVIDNLNFAVESMTRTIKTNKDYSFGATDESISAVDDDGDTLTDSMSEDGGLGRIMLQRNGVPVPITAPEVDIDDFQVIRLYQDNPSDCTQPFVALVVRGTARVGGEETQFSLQTVVSQRDLRIKSVCL